MGNQNEFFGSLNKIISEQIPDFKEKAEELMADLYKNSPNIFICGKTGVGKSTLINKIFRDEVAKTGIGKPVTPDIRKYHKDNVPINIFDTPGFEIGNNKAREEVISYIENHTKDSDPKNNIHIMWYCIAGPGSKIEGDEIAFINEVNKKTDLAIIVLVTKTDMRSVGPDGSIGPDESEILFNYIKDQNLPISNILQVSANMNINLKELITITNQLLPEAFRKAFINAQIVNIEEKEKAAHKWMITYVGSAAITGFIPIPFSSWMAIVPVQLTMLIHISIIYGLDVDKALIQSLLTGAFTSSAATILGRFLAGLAKFIPGIGTLVGGIIDASIAGSITTAIGIAYIKLLSKAMKSKINGNELTFKEMDDLLNKEFKQASN